SKFPFYKGRLLMRKIASAVMAAALVCINCTASAAFVDQDLTAIGDGLLTLDTSTQLQWLDITATSGLTFRAIELGAGGWASRGFRAATRPELEQLFSSVGIVVGPPRTRSNAPGVLTLMEHLGCNLCYLGSTLIGGSVLYGDEALSANGLLGHATFSVDVYGDGFASAAGTWADAWDLGSSNLTTILVRAVPQPVPEPSTAVLLGAGIMIVGALKRARKTPAA
ncbi:PEP-CTERM sorting domain-containing protein, partial [Paucibacter sp. DJ1R-11]|uniref:PEP-CTERM sorting domain-containing protein n=1 Tax=Paucibacter sp. DJ1R-11 TaxID=2893556 RepID=UPI0021E491D9